MPTTAEPGQRSFELDARLPWPPDDLRPMLPRAARRMPDGSARLVDPTWGGLRVLASVRGPDVRLLVNGSDVAGRFPDLVGTLASLELPGALLDGEIVVPGAHRRALAGTHRLSLASGMRRRSGPIRPATFVVSDLPWLGGLGLLDQPLVRRRERLSALAIAAPGLVTIEPAAGADAVLQLVALHGLVGITAKRADSPYLPGVRSRLWTLVRVADALTSATGMLTLATPHGTTTPERPDIALLRTLPLGEDP